MPLPPLTGIAVCVFDAYGTLFDVQRIAMGARDLLGERAEALGDLWRRKQLEYTWLRSLMGRHADFWHVTGESLDYAMASLGLADPALRARLMDAHLTPPLQADARGALDGLRAAGFKLAILSNGSPTMLTSAVKQADLWSHFDAMLSVEAAGVYKPHPSVYRVATDKFACAPAQVAFVSANSWDAAGADAFGFQSIWVNRRGAPADELPARAQREVASLAELPSMVRS